jgi:hypothetical protein
MGVRSSVEVKSINSMQGGVSSKKNHFGGTGGGQNDVRKSAQATSMQSLIDNHQHGYAQSFQQPGGKMT